MNNKKEKLIISAAGLVTLAGVFILWWQETDFGTLGRLAACVSLALFAAVCLRFVPGFVDHLVEKREPVRTESVPGSVSLKIFLLIALWDLFLLLAVFLLRRSMGSAGGFRQSLDHWLYLDSHHYLDIARDWYLSEGERDRLVQLVFFPGYPVTVRLMHLLIPDYTLAGFFVSLLCFSGSGCMLYKLMRLDCGHSTALRAVVFFCIFPASFFFAAPMSESLFVFCSLCCLYFVRQKKTLTGCLFGAYAAFTRSLGVLLLAPVLMELIAERRKPSDYLKTLIIPVGFFGYLLINYLVAGDPFKFMEYQREHWGQGFGWFFNTAAYQSEHFVKSLSENPANALGLWLPNLLSQLLALSVMTAAAKKLRPSYTAHFIAYFAVAIGATWLLSAPRYLAAMTALPVASAILSEKRRVGLCLSALYLMCGALYLLCFCMGWQVW